VVYPIILTVRALQYKRENEIDEEENRKRLLILLAITFVLFSLLENIILTYDNRFFLLLVLFIGGMVAKDKGFIDVGMERLNELIEKRKTP
jgi:hypothetical protein